jgi:hypothetical protein
MNRAALLEVARSGLLSHASHSLHRDDSDW